MPLPLLGFKGKRKAGKDTIAKILVGQHGYQREAFADALKREVYDAFGEAMLFKEAMEAGFRSHWAFAPDMVSFDAWMTFVDSHKNDPANSEFGWLGPYLQFHGTEYRREKCGQTYWLEKMAPKLGPGVVVSDVRFQNEADLIRQHGGLTIHINRPSLEATDDGAARGSSHISESGLDGIGEDFIFTNNDSWDQLPEQVAAALQEWMVAL